VIYTRYTRVHHSRLWYNLYLVIVYDRTEDDRLYCLDTLDLVAYWCEEPATVNGSLVGEYNEGAYLRQGVCISASVFTVRRVCIARTTQWQDVRSSVCLSHAGILNGYTFSPSGSPTILVFHKKRDGNMPTGTPLTGASNARRYENSRFSTNISLYLGIDAR